MMYRVTVTRQSDVPDTHPLARKDGETGVAYLPEPGCSCIVYSERDTDRGLVTSIVQSVLGCTYKEDGKTFDTVTFKTKNTKYVMKIHNEVN